MGEVRHGRYNRRMQPRGPAPFVFLELSWGASIPDHIGSSATVCAFLCLLLGALLILFAIKEMKKVRRLGRRLAVG